MAQLKIRGFRMIVRRWQAVLLVAVVLSLGSSPVLAEKMTAQDEAEAAAKAWLAVVDEGHYGESWDAASALFREEVTKAEWETMVQSAREALGAVGSRTLESARFARQLPGAPDGEYVVLQYQSEFENQASVMETITPQRQDDGSWAVSGYYIR